MEKKSSPCKLWRASHPPVSERIDFANAYKPWLKIPANEPLNCL